MSSNQIMDRLSSGTVYSRDELYSALSLERNKLSDSTFRWILYHLLLEEKIFRIDYDAYVIDKPQMLPEYKPDYSDKAKTLMEELAVKYPHTPFVIFESTLMNEFLNHQIAQNTIYVQITKDISSYVFDNLQEEYPGRVLYRPNKGIFNTYWTKDCIVVLDLISQAPLSKDNPHDMTAEKMLVDIIAEKSIAATYSPAELPQIFENVRRNYRIDRHKISRYAGRRGKSSLVDAYVGGEI